MKQDKIYIYGKHALTEALRNNPRAVDRIFAASALEGELATLVQKAGIRVDRLSGSTMPGDMERNATHQGLIGRVSLHALVRPYKDFIETLKVTPDTCVIVLGELQDPHNVGAVIRSAAAFGVAAVFIPEHKQAPVTGAVVKVSAGMAFRVPLVQIGNVNNTLEDLKKRGFWVYGLDGEAKQSIVDETFEKATALVLGNEGDGIRVKTLELCDIPVSIPMSPDCESLNVAASAAVALYAWSSKHPAALTAPRQ
jgi:23S rRNA (guanosine2251-2'-O)-methyltransferase